MKAIQSWMSNKQEKSLYASLLDFGKGSIYSTFSLFYIVCGTGYHHAHQVLDEMFVFLQVNYSIFLLFFSFCYFSFYAMKVVF